MHGIQLSGFGHAKNVTRLVELPDQDVPAPDEVVIEILAAPVEPTDLYVIAGTYGMLSSIPSILGTHGVGRVTAVGRHVRHLKEAVLQIIGTQRRCSSLQQRPCWEASRSYRTLSSLGA